MTPSAAPIVARLRAAGCVFAEDEAELLIADAADASDLDAMVARRTAGVPLEHVLGWARFCGLRIAVDPAVFVPRRRTEFLVAQAAARTPPAGIVVDLCCGTGAVGAALAATVDGIEVHATDIDPAATRCARRNLATVPGDVYDGDLYAPLPAALRGRVDVIVAITPYVPTEAIATMPPEARLHEPRVALDGGADGLDVLRRVVADAPRWLAPGGCLLSEIGRHQVLRAMEIIAGGGLVPAVAESDEQDATVAVATR